MSAIQETFHATEQDDDTIAQNLTHQSISTSSRQVKRIRLENNWQRRVYDDDQLAQNRARTLDLVKQALQRGECCSYGRGLMRTYLHVKFQHNAREDDVRDAIQMLDKKGTESRRPEPNKDHLKGEYITPGPD